MIIGKHKTMTLKWFPLVLAIFPVIILTGCDYARMSDQEAIRTYEISMPDMPEGTIPITGGIKILRDTDPADMKNPVISNQEAIIIGERHFGYFCIFCHGKQGNGYGTVGQSFYPLPADLTSERVMEKSDGQLFHIISLGLNRMPPLASTVSEEDRWYIIHYLRSLEMKRLRNAL